jgi:hypothetical protein
VSSAALTVSQTRSVVARSSSAAAAGVMSAKIGGVPVIVTRMRSPTASRPVTVPVQVLRGLPGVGASRCRATAEGRIAA